MAGGKADYSNQSATSSHRIGQRPSFSKYFVWTSPFGIEIPKPKESAVERVAEIKPFPVIGVCSPASAVESTKTKDDLLQRLGPDELKLVRVALGPSTPLAVDEAAIERLKHVHPGVRELRIRNFINSIWAEGHLEVLAGSRTEIPSSERPVKILAQQIRFRSAYHDLKFILDLDQPTKEEKIEAVLLATPLSDEQKAILNSMDPAAFKELFSRMGEEERMDYLGQVMPGLFSVSSFMHKIRFAKPENGDHVVSMISEKIAHQRFETFLNNGVAPPADRAVPKKASAVYGEWWDLVRDVQTGTTYVTGNDGHDVRVRNSKILEKMKDTLFAGQSSPLYCEAHKFADYYTLLEFLGIPFAHPPTVSFDLLRPIMKSASTHPIEDSATVLELRFGDGAHITLDAVFDGVSGPQGNSGGAIASSKAKEVLEVAAMSGWIRSPEDVRMVFIMADFLVQQERLDKKQYSMSTTGTVSYVLDGKDFYGIHCGDSAWHVFSEGAVWSFAPHVPFTNGGVKTNFILPPIGGGCTTITINNNESNYGALRLSEGAHVLTASDGVDDIVLKEEYFFLLTRLVNPEVAARVIFELAESRSNDEGTHPAIHDKSVIVGGKDDDKTLILRRI